MARVWKFGADVDTDQIVPGRYAPFMLKEGDDVKNYAFVDANPAFNTQAQPGDIIVINHSSLIYGEGNEAESRRRHRPVDEDAGEQTLVMQRPTRPNRPD